MPDPDKRRMRELKRAVKKRGNKHRRQQLKRDLVDNPEEAASPKTTWESTAPNGSTASTTTRPARRLRINHRRLQRTE